MEKDLSIQRLPPGQSRTAKFPVVGEKMPPPEALDLAAWRLQIGGLVRQPLQLTYPEVLALPQGELQFDIHCVTGWSRPDSRFGGTPLAHLLRLTEPMPEARFVRFIAYSERRHDTSLPFDLARAETWVIHSRDGFPLAPEHGYPLRTVTPSRYFYKSLKWLRAIELMADDQLGYWERESDYHNGADPWPGDQRFTTGSLKPERARRFRLAASFAPYRSGGKALIGLDLRNWRPATQHLGAIQLKACDLRGARLAGVQLAGANLSLCDLRGADLSAADLRGADLEGANFSGADLRGADFRDTLLNATRFFESAGGQRRQARIEGLRWQGGRGLLEEQEAFLAGNPNDSGLKS